jgi:PAS domain S-box-containing protein
MAVKVYVGVVAVLAAIVTAVCAATTHPVAAPHVGFLLFFVVIIALTESLQVRYFHHDQVDALNLMEGVLAPLLFVGSAPELAVVVAAGTILAGLVGRNPVVKTFFNAAQWVLAASIGSLVFHALLPADRSSGGALGALALGIVAMSLVNLAAISGVLSVVSGSPIGSRNRKDARGVLMGHAIGNISSLTAGVALTAAYRWSHWSLFIAVVLVVGMHATGRANAAVRADHKRLEGLQRATHALATSLDVAQALPDFLAEARAGFEVRAIDLVLFSDSGTVVHRCDGDTAADYAVTTRPHPLAELLATSAAEPVRLSIATAEAATVRALAETGHQRALAVPLMSGDAALGMLFLYDRAGMEGFESGEASVATALGRELVGFVERVDLVRAIDEERRKLADILESTSDGILTIDSDGVVTSWNAGLAGITGYAADEMVGTRHIGLLRARDGNGRDVLVERWIETADTSPGLPSELQIVTQDGQIVWLSCSYSRIPASEGRREVLVVVARNITQARELERLKDDFVAVVSHELRTPLVPIKGWAQTLINRGDRLTDDQRRTAVQSILAQAQKLESLVLNILEASRIESGRADSEGVADVAAIAMRIVEDTLSARPDRTVRVRPPSVPCQVRGSAVWVERAVSNLVANAVKYSPDDEPVDVSISVEDNDVVVTVTDRGPGIAVDAQDRIFERFERLEETIKQTGTGLGLYITRRLARAMGGDVSVSSVPGAGSTFLLRLPVAPVTRLPEQRSAGTPMPSRIDDDITDVTGNVVRLR